VSSKKRTYKKRSQKRNLVNKKKSKKGGGWVDEQNRDADSDDDEKVSPTAENASLEDKIQFLRKINDENQKKKALELTSEDGKKALGSYTAYTKMADE
jgi:hypothetical protein